MSIPKDKPKTKFIIALMYKKYPDDLISGIEKNFGEIDERSDEIDFNFTGYYEKEFGKDLRKRFLSFKRSFDLEKLPDAKLFCSEIEKIYSKGGKRLVNIDPGYITNNSVVLASFKERAHRIYLREGVYADLEMVFENNEWHAFRWTFPDIQEIKIKEFLKKAKEKIKEN